MSLPATTTTVPVFGIECFCGDVPDAARAILRRLEEKTGGYICFCNAHVAVTAQHDRRVEACLSSAFAVFADGAPVAWVQRHHGHPEARRVPGPDVMPEVIAAACRLGTRHFLLGSTNDVLELLRGELARRYPGVNIVGALAPQVSDPTRRDDALVATVRAVRPDVVWCGMGAPKQELWMLAHEQALAPALLVGVGAAFDFLAGTKRRAPAAFQRAGLEWLFRLATEPRRLWRRYLLTNTEFLRLAVHEFGRRG
jgi:N-acetylglucosaminyldiphosphoundecaprenol N-acetyl-beta-D-mannosaminyltransferase